MIYIVGKSKKSTFQRYLDAFRCEHHAIRKITNEMIANVRDLIGYAKQKLYHRIIWTLNEHAVIF